MCEFLRVYGGPNNSFYEQAKGVDDYGLIGRLASILHSFRDYVAQGLLAEVSPERQAQLDVVSDILAQAQTMLDQSDVHPAAPAMVIGASLEEFLRTWCEAEMLEAGGRKPCIDTYAKMLRSAELISKQDIKDIVSWAGTRNDAAHGKWEAVDDRARIRNVLEGVHLFMRKAKVPVTLFRYCITTPSIAMGATLRIVALSWVPRSALLHC